MTEQRQSNKAIVSKLVLLVFGMFAFGFALVPLYEVFCDITGINGKTRNEAVELTESAVDESRELTIQFIASVKRGMPWEFRPVDAKIKVHPGQVYQTSFYAKNLSNKEIIGQAIPSVSPGQAALYMNKTECFCFNQQVLAAQEEVEMGLVFFIDKDIPEDVKTLTLSYSLFNVSDQVNAQNTTAP